jgi:hypothetical protein
VEGDAGTVVSSEMKMVPFSIKTLHCLLIHRVEDPVKLRDKKSKYSGG